MSEALRETLAGAGTPPVVLCHVSHVYPAGASLYFTVGAAAADDPLRQWAAAKRAASDAIAAAGATISHHHGVGRDHAPWLPAEVGELGVAALAAVKRVLDPAGIMNPGVLGLEGGGMETAERLRRLAELAVRTGANVQPGQVVAISTEPGKEALTRAVAEQAYLAGAKYVEARWFDPASQAAASASRRSGLARLRAPVARGRHARARRASRRPHRPAWGGRG